MCNWLRGWTCPLLFSWLLICLFFLAEMKLGSKTTLITFFLRISRILSTENTLVRSSAYCWSESTHLSGELMASFLSRILRISKHKRRSSSCKPELRILFTLSYMFFASHITAPGIWATHTSLFTRFKLQSFQISYHNCLINSFSSYAFPQAWTSAHVDDRATLFNFLECHDKIL